MSRLPTVSGREAIKAFEKAGFECDRIKGAHHILKKKGRRRRLSIPVHGSTPLKAGLLRGQIGIAGLTVEQFVDLL